MKKLTSIISFLFIGFACVAEPVKSMLASDRTEIIGDESFENPYVSDSLVFMLDANWNAGFDEHQDGLVNYWKELVSGKYLECDVTAYETFSVANTSQTVRYALDEPLELDEITVEVVCDKPSENFNRIEYFLQCNGSVYDGFTQNNGTSQLWPFRALLGGSNTWAFNFNIVDGYGLFHYQVVGSVHESQGGVFRYGAIHGWRSMSMSSQFLTTIYSKPLVGTKIYALRIHSRKLSEKEIKYNYLVDCERFGL